MALCVVCGAEARAEEVRSDPQANAALAATLGGDHNQLRRDDLLTRFLVAPRREPRKRRKTLDLTPLVERAIVYVRDLGVPLVEQRDKKGSPIAVSASFSVGEDMPAIKLHLGDVAPEPFGAFFPGRKGFRWSVIYPVRNLTLRLEAGEDSEFGNVGIAGVQWVHPNQHIAAGIGMPVKMSNSDGAIGAIFQFRLKWN